MAKMGAPTKYNEDMLESTKTYIDGAYEISGEVIPTIAGLSLFLELCEDTLHVWKNEDGKEDFSLLIKKLKAKQKSILIAKGLLGDFNSTIAKLILHKHGYSEKKEVSGPGEGPIKTENKWIIETVRAEKR